MLVYESNMPREVTAGNEEFRSHCSDIHEVRGHLIGISLWPILDDDHASDVGVIFREHPHLLRAKGIRFPQYGCE